MSTLFNPFYSVIFSSRITNLELLVHSPLSAQRWYTRERRIKATEHLLFLPRLNTTSPTSTNTTTTIIMPLELRPNCELCDKDLSPSATDARICSYECTFCAHCVETRLANVCPNCGGGLTARPIRPATAWREGLCVALQPPSEKRVRLNWRVEDIDALVARVAKIAPEHR